MKKNKEHERPKEADERVETPSPPQVMDPSVPPKEQKNTEKGKDNAKRPSKTKNDSVEQKLAPKEEL
jgi:hypothetical protein